MKATAGAVVVGRIDAKRVAAPAPVPVDAVEALRRRLAGQTAREHVVLDFLSDDLREAKGALAILTGYLGRIEGTVADPGVTQQKLLSLAISGGPIDQLDYLAEVLASLRRRLGQVAARME
jgi:hypothetical protein